MSHPSPKPPAAAMDAVLWDSGYQNARSPQNPHELDFLRGFHNRAALTHLKNWLQSNSGANIRLTSVWQDKYGNVVPNPLAPGPHYSYQEVADLAVIVRDAQNRQASAWMWLLQAKVVKNSSSKLPAGQSTDREIYLYEAMPDFTWHGKHSQGLTFQLKKDFPGPAAYYKHWSFLCFRENTQPCPSNKFIDVRWPGSPVKGLAVASVSDELLELVTHFSTSQVPTNPYGAPLVKNFEWAKLAQQILHKARSRPQSGHASSLKGQKADVLKCAMIAENNPGSLNWIDAEGGGFDGYCEICFPDACLYEARLEGILYSSISTGFDGNQPKFNLSRAMRRKLNAADRKSVIVNVDEGRGNGGGNPPADDNQRDGEDGGSGVMLTLFVDVAGVEAGKFGA